MNLKTFFKPSFIAGYILAAFVTIGCYTWLIKRATMSFEEKFRQEVRDINSKLPMHVDAFTVMDSVAYIDSTPEEAAYYYSICGEIDNPVIWNKQAIEALRQHTIEDLCKNDMTLQMRQRRFVFSYHYYSESDPSLLLTEFIIGPEDYSY